MHNSFIASFAFLSKPTTSVALAVLLLGGCSDLASRFGAFSDVSPRQDVSSTAAIAPQQYLQAATAQTRFAPLLEPAAAQGSLIMQHQSTEATVVSKRAEKAISFAEFRSKQQRFTPQQTLNPFAEVNSRQKVLRREAPLTTGSIKPVAYSLPSSHGASTVEVGEGDTLFGIARRHGVSVSDLISANQLADYNILIGQKLVIPANQASLPQNGNKLAAGPRFVEGNRAAPDATGSFRPAYKVKKSDDLDKTHIVVPGDDLSTLARQYDVSWTRLAFHNHMEPNSRLVPGTLLMIPSDSPAYGQSAAAAPTDRNDWQNEPTGTTKPYIQEKVYRGQVGTSIASLPAVRRQNRSAPLTTTSISRSFSSFPTSLPSKRPAKLSQHANSYQSNKPKVSTTNAPSVNQLKDEVISNRIQEFGFRWPAQGRLIRDFGKSPGGVFNEGINIALPVGSTVKAAEAGEVTFSGSYPYYGNLVVIRHANGWVSIYAHNDKLKVSKSDRVVRGQAIAASGTTGEVTTPQLHFQLRKGKKPYNPLSQLPKT